MDFAAADTYRQIEMDGAMPALNMEPDGAGRIIVQQTGDYEVSYHVQISANNPVTMALAVRSNEAVLPQTESTWALTGNPEDPTIAAACAIISLAAGSALELAASAIGSLPTDFTVALGGNANAMFTVKKLSQ